MMVRRRHTFSRHDNRHALQTDGTYLDKVINHSRSRLVVVILVVVVVVVVVVVICFCDL